MAKYVDDELDELPVVTSKKAAKTTPTPIVETTIEVSDEEAPEDTPDEVAETSTEVDDEFEVGWGDKKTMSYSDGLDRLRPEKGQKVRFAILTAKPKKAYTHYVKGKGNILCLSQTHEDEGSCCAKMPSDSPRVLTAVALILHYSNANLTTAKYEPVDGKMPPIEWKIMYIQMGKANYSDISELPEEGKTPMDIDISMTAKNAKTGSGGWKFGIASSEARWKKNPALVKEVAAALVKFSDNKKLKSKLGKVVSVVEMKEILKAISGSASAEEASLEDIEDLS
jgi:hypothetical protein